MASTMAAAEPRSAALTDTAARTVARALLRQLHGGTLVVEEGPRQERFGDGGDLRATMRVRHPSMWRRALQGGGVGFAEAYIDALWDADDVVSVLRVLARNLDRLNAIVRNPVARMRSLVQSVLRSGTPTEADDRRNIRAHYDLGDDFFQLFLDETMAYSCAYFPTATTALRDASEMKFERICRMLGLGRDSRVIEIGTGWGGFAVYAARHYGCHVDTTTISERQYAYAHDLVRREELQARVRVLRDHYRDLRGTYTHLVSIEMIEAVDWRLYDDFFSCIQRLLEPGGCAAIQAITVDDREFDRSKTWQDFIKRYIFPGGCLPSVGAMVDTTKRVTDLSLVELHDIGQHYALTLRNWRENLDARHAEARARGFDDRFLRMWRYYFAYCEAGFAERRISDVQTLWARPGWRQPAVALAGSSGTTAAAAVSS